MRVWLTRFVRWWAEDMARPRVLVVTRRTSRKNRQIEYVGVAHLENLLEARLLPVIVPVAPGAPACLPEYSRGMQGLLLVEGEDIEPKHYRARRGNFKYLEKTDPLKDQIEMRLLRQALRRRLPVLGICRGSQLLNVACGGTLYGDAQKERKSRLKHINYEHYDAYRHSVRIVQGSPLHLWYGREQLRVNSYHHQGVRDLAARFRVMAFAPDGLVEGFFDPKEEFVVGLQFHPERMEEEPVAAAHIWKAFATAVRKRGSRL
jgi:gamma-glutamyl-gamma-aminobutyrate hydrolase PuuD